MRFSIHASMSILFLIATFFPFTLHAEAPWKEVSHKDGIRVWSRKLPGTNLVEFKGQGLADSSIKDIFAVLYDSDHKLDLLSQSEEYRLVEIHSKTQFTIYNHIKSPFLLVSDRDVVLKTDMVFDPKNKMLITPFWNISHPSIPARNGIERMPKCRGSWTLEYKGPNKTLITYEVESDPGGWVPSWVVNIANKKLPHQTIANMRRQAKKKHIYKKSHAIIEEHFELDTLLGLSPSPSP